MKLTTCFGNSSKNAPTVKAIPNYLGSRLRMRLCFFPFLAIILGMPLLLNAGSFSLPACDWQNRGDAFNLVLDPTRPLVYVQMDGGVDNDLSIFDYADPAHLKFLGKVKGFGTHVARADAKLLSIAKGRGMSIWDMADPLHPTLSGEIGGTESWWTGSSYSNGRLSSKDGVLYRLAGTSLTTFRINRLKSLDRLQQFSNLPGQYAYNHVVVSENVAYCASQYTGTYNLCVFGKSGQLLQQLTNLTVSSPSLASYAGGGQIALFNSGRHLLMSSRGEDRVHIVDVGDPANPRILPPYILEDNKSRIGCFVPIDDHHVMVAKEWSGSLQILQVSPNGQLSKISDPLNLNTWVQYGVCSGSHVFFTGFHTDLTMVDVSDVKHPKLVGQADPNPSLDQVAVDGNHVYQLARYFNQGGVPIVSELNQSTGQLAPWRNLTDGYEFRNVAAFRGTVILDNFFALTMLQRQPNGEHVRVTNVNYRSSVSYSDRKTHLNDQYAIVGEQVFGLAGNKGLKLIGSLPSNALVSFGRYAVCADGIDAIVVDVSKQMAVSRRIPGPVFDARGVANRAVIKKKDSLCVITAGPSEELSVSEYYGYPSEPSFKKWNVSLNEQFLILWSGSEANIYSLPMASQPRLLGSCEIPRNYCRGGWYGFLSQNYFLTADAFTGLVAMRLDAGNAIIALRNGSDGSTQVEWDTVNGRLYDVMCSTNLTDWLPEATGIRGTGKTMIQSGRSKSSASTFYRVVDTGE
jgi:hypothetical protein